METIAQKTKRIIAELLGADEAALTTGTNLKKDLGADSLDIVELVSVLEKEFNVSVPDDKIEYLRTVGDFINHFERTRRVEVPVYYELRAA